MCNKGKTDNYLHKISSCWSWIMQGCHEILPTKFKDILRIFSWFSRIFKLGPTHVKLPHSGADSRISMRCNALNTGFKDFKDHFQNSRTFQGSSKMFTKIQGLFKDFMDRHEIQGFFQGCGNPVMGPKNIHSRSLCPVETEVYKSKVHVLYMWNADFIHLRLAIQTGMR